MNHLILGTIGEPNQKWHFFESYVPHLKELYKQRPGDAETQKTGAIYNKIRCPELLLWIAEASGIEHCKVCVAARAAKNIIDTKEIRCRNKAGNAIRKIIQWKDIEKQIEEERKREEQKKQNRDKKKGNSDEQKKEEDNL